MNAPGHSAACRCEDCRRAGFRVTVARIVGAVGGIMLVVGVAIAGATLFGWPVR